MTRPLEQSRLVEDRLRLELAIALVKSVDPESINEHKSGDARGDRTATEGFYWGTIQQLRNYHRVAQNKAKQLYA